jgi:hypothetical protein
MVQVLLSLQNRGDGSKKDPADPQLVIDQERVPPLRRGSGRPQDLHHRRSFRAARILTGR